MPPGSPALEEDEEPQGNNDPGDPLQPGIEEENSGRTPPISVPTAGTDAFEDDEAPETVEAMDEATREDEEGDAAPLDEDDESELEELDEKEFEDFDPSALNIPDKPVQVDADNVGLLGVHKRKRTEEEELARKKKKKEGRREKPKRQKKNRELDDDFEGGVEIDGKRVRKSKVGPDGRPSKAIRRPRTPENEDNLTPDERKYSLCRNQDCG